MIPRKQIRIDRNLIDKISKQCAKWMIPVKSGLHYIYKTKLTDAEILKIIRMVDKYREDQKANKKPLLSTKEVAAAMAKSIISEVRAETGGFMIPMAKPHSKHQKP